MRCIKTTRLRAAALFTGLAIAISLIAVVALQRLVFGRLRRIADVLVRVVGGEYDHRVPVGPRDELGEVEILLEQMRRVLVDAARQAERRGSR